MNRPRKDNEQLPFGKTSRTAIREERLPVNGDANHTEVHVNNRSRCIQEELCSQKDFNQKKNQSAGKVKKGDAFSLIEEGCHQHPHPYKLNHSRKQKSSKRVERKDFQNFNNHLNEVQTKYARTVCIPDSDVAGFHKHSGSQKKVNLSNYGKMVHKSTLKKTLTSPPRELDRMLKFKLFEQNDISMKSSETEHLNQNTSSDTSCRSEPVLVESWDIVEETVHRRWKSQSWWSLPQDGHLPEQ
ncbi:uncharacterized protein LOC134256523 isoform X2 [Saccostrea cucullata]|uniref:uncharacterized protein LOC134256523 isoform X2 n=1 Tax=Saccostrea cuccullata TaxID=36930 RepID=UPI002ED467D3